MRCVKAEKNSKIPLGRQGENDVLKVRFDVSEWPDIYGSGGSFVLTHIRPGDAQPYVCATSVASDGYLEWDVQNTDIAVIGRGECQLSYVVGDAVAKSVIYTTDIYRSLDQEGELPEPYESMIEDLIEAAASVTTEANRAEAAATAAETSKTNAQTFQTSAAASAIQAASSRQGAANSATLAQSWAEGGTGTRSGEDTDNAEYWATLAQQRAEAAGYVLFEVDNSDGCMYVTLAGSIGEDVTFEINEETGNLEVIYT